MDRVHGATESAAFCKRLDFEPAEGRVRRGVRQGAEQAHVTTRRLRYGMVGGGRDAFIGAVHRARDGARRAGRAGRRRALVDRRSRRARRAATSASPTTATTARWQELLDDELRAPADERIDVVVHRHAEPRALPGREGLRRGRLPRRLRQAAGAHQRAGRGARRAASRSSGTRVRRHLQLHRLPDGARRRASMVRARRDRRAAQGRRRVQPGLARDAARGDRQQAGRLAHRPGAQRHRRRDGRHRLARREPRRDHHRAGSIESLCADLTTFVPGPPARRRRQPCCCASRAARAACCSRRRSRSATRTTCASACIGERGLARLAPGGSEPARARAGRRPAPRCCAAATTTCSRVGAEGARRIPPGHPEGYHRGLRERLPRRRSRRSARGRRAASSARSRASSRRVEDGARGVRFIERVIESGASDAEVDRGVNVRGRASGCCAPRA